MHEFQRGRSKRAWFKRASSTIVQSAPRSVSAMVPDPILNQARRRPAFGGLRLIWAAVGVFVFCAHSAVAQGLSRHHHAWGRFHPGAWNLVREETDTFGEAGTTTTITETRTSLDAVQNDGVTLSIQRAVDFEGKQFTNPSQSVKQAFHGGLATQKATVKSLGSGMVTIQGSEIPCKIEQVEVSGSTGKTTTKIYYSDSIKPYVLRRRSIKTAPDGESVLSEITVEVVALGVPCEIVSGLSRAIHVKTVHKHPGGTVETVSRVSTAVPGGILLQTSKELDENDHFVRRNTLTLVDWGLQPEKERVGLLQRRRIIRRKSRKFTPYHFPAPRSR